MSDALGIRSVLGGLVSMTKATFYRVVSSQGLSRDLKKVVIH